MLSDASADAIERLDDYGMALGLAFQLSDDIMDVIATEEELRKEPGQDIREGVYTLPVLYAMRDSQELTELLALGKPSGERFRRAFELVKQEPSLDRARTSVSREVRRAVRLAEGLEPGTARDALVHIAEFIAARCGAHW